MVDTPQLTPTAPFTRRGGAREVPTIRRDLVADLRRVPSVRPTGLEAAARAFNVQAGVFGELQRQFQISAEEGLEEIRREQQVEAERIYSEKRLEIEGSIAELEVNPELAKGDIAGATIGVYDTATEQALDQAKSPFQKRYLEEKFSRGRTDVGTRAIRKQAKREIAEREVDFSRKLESNQSLIASSPDTYDEVLLEQMEALSALPITPKQRVTLEKEVREGFAVSRIRGLLRDNPDEAEAILADEKFTEDLSPASLAAAKEDVEIAKIKEQAFADLGNQVSRGQTFQSMGDKAQAGELTHTEVNDMVESGALSQEQGGELVVEIQKEQLAAEEKAADIAEVAGALNGLDVVTGADTRKVNTAYKDAIAPMLANMDPQQAMLTKARFVEATNKIPSIMSREIKGQLAGGSPDQKLEAARLVQLIREKSQFASSNNRDLSATTEANADRILNMLEAGISEEDVMISLEQQESQVNQATTEIRRKEFKKQFDQEGAVQKAKDTFDTILTREPDVSLETGTEQRLLQDMQVLAEKYYTDNPDMDAAMDYASRQIKRQYGVTRTGGGGRRLMKFAPETFYTIDGDSSWVEEQMVADVNGLLNEGTQAAQAELDAFFDSIPTTDSVRGPNDPPGQPRPGQTQGIRLRQDQLETASELFAELRERQGREGADTESILEQLGQIQGPLDFAEPEIERGLKLFEKLNKSRSIDKEDIFLVPDRDTSREAADGMPAYTLMVKNEDGTLQTVGQRWQPDVERQKVIAKERRIARANKKFEAAKEAANRKIRFRELMRERSGFDGVAEGQARARERLEQRLGRPVESPFAQLEEFFFGDE